MCIFAPLFRPIEQKLFKKFFISIIRDKIIKYEHCKKVHRNEPGAAHRDWTRAGHHPGPVSS